MLLAMCESSNNNTAQRRADIMTKTDIYNQLKQAEYKLDIEAIQALIWAEQSYYPEGRKDWTDKAERKQSEAMGMFKALKELLPDTLKLKLNEETVKLMWEYMNIRQELKEIKENLQKEAA